MQLLVAFIVNVEIQPVQVAFQSMQDEQFAGHAVQMLVIRPGLYYPTGHLVKVMHVPVVVLYT